MSAPARLSAYRLAAGAIATVVCVACGGDGWHQEDGYRWRGLQVPAGGRSGFTRLEAAETAVDFENTVDLAAALRQRNLFNGAGVAAGDVNSDGLPDLYFAGTARPNALYLNRGGMRFESVAAPAADEPALQSTGAAFADTDGDRDLDLLLTAVGDTRLYENDGSGVFTNASAARGITGTSGSTSVALADIERDGDLDLYVANYRKETIRDAGAMKLQRVDGQLQIPPSMADRLVMENGNIRELGEPDYLFLNDGSGTFALQSWTDGRFVDEGGQALTKPPLDWGLAAAFHDLNNDGAPDLYVANDFETPDRIWINDGAGRFHAAGEQAIRTISTTSMGVDFSDVDRDGDLDLFVDDMLSPDWQRRQRQIPASEPERPSVGDDETRAQVPHNTLLLARGDGTYAEAANLAGVEASDWSWATSFLDVDLDGYEDILIVTGHPYDMQDADSNARQGKVEGTEPKRMAVLSYPKLETPMVAFRNRGDLTFERVSEEWGFDDAGVTHGLALADLDADGDLDAVTNSLHKAAGIYRNESSAPRVAVRLAGKGPNTQGIGAKIRLSGGGLPSQSKEMIAGGRYLSGSEPLVVFAAGLGSDLKLEVDWPSGATSLIDDVQPNRIYEVAERATASPRTPTPTPPDPLFEDVSATLAHRHVEDDYDDFKAQPLLPNRLSLGGPGVAWMDVNGDGADDLIVGTGRGGRPASYLNDGNGALAPDSASAEGPPFPGDTTGFAGLSSEKGRALAMGIAGFGLDAPAAAGGASEASDPAARAEQAVDGAVAFVGGEGEPLVLRQPASPGPLAAADVDADGDLDLFVGGRALPGRWPEPAPSVLMRRQSDGWSTETLFEGLATGAVWTDLTGDGLPELVVAREWAAPAVFENVGGTLRDATADWGLAGMTGWWQGVDSGDLDGDGRMDLVLTNWGTNTPYTATDASPAAILYGDADADGDLEIVEVGHDPDRGNEVPLRRIDDLGKAVPSIGPRVESFADYASGSLEDVLGPELPRLTRLEANTLLHTALLNRGGKFEARPLPVEAQLAPAFGVNVADFDGDGNADVFLAQNFSGQQPRQPAATAGRGLLLTGDGTGSLRPVPGPESGLLIYGDGRGSAAADYDRDGRLDLAVGQNGGQTKLFRNRGAEPAVVVRLAGPAENPDGVGAQVRGDASRNGGPVFEIHSGSGYWSLNGPEVLLPRAFIANAVDVRWPAAQATGSDSATPPGWITYQIPPDAAEVRLLPDGTVDQVR